MSIKLYSSFLHVHCLISFRNSPDYYLCWTVENTETERGWETCLSHTGSTYGRAGNKHRQTDPSPSPPSIITPHHPWAPPAPRMRASQSSLIDKVTRTLGLWTVSIYLPSGQERWWQLIIYFRPGAPERFIAPPKIEHFGGMSTTPKSQLAIQ